MTIQGPPGNNSNHPEPIRGNGNASRAHQVPFTTPLPVDHLLGKLFKYLTRCGRGTRAVHARCGYSPIGKQSAAPRGPSLQPCAPFARTLSWYAPHDTIAARVPLHRVVNIVSGSQLCTFDPLGRCHLVV